MTPDEQLDYLAKGSVDLIDRKDLRAKLARGKPLTVKVGFDPTAPDLHLGHTVVIRKMKTCSVGRYRPMQGISE